MTDELICLYFIEFSFHSGYSNLLMHALALQLILHKFGILSPHCVSLYFDCLKKNWWEKS